MKSIVATFAAAVFAACFSGGSAWAQSGACNRACLEGFVDRYLDALVKHDPSAVPLAANVRFTENGQRLAIGDALWRSMQFGRSTTPVVLLVTFQSVEIVSGQKPARRTCSTMSQRK